MANYLPGNLITATITYKGTFDGYISGWVDSYQNGIYENSERVTVEAPQSGTSMVLQCSVPFSRIIRSTYVRLRYGRNQSDLRSPTRFTLRGEAEDCSMFIQGPTFSNPMLPSKETKKLII